MRSIGSIFILGLFMASATAEQVTTERSEDSTYILNTITIATPIEINGTNSMTTNNNGTTNDNNSTTTKKNNGTTTENNNGTTTENNNKTTNGNNGTTTIKPSTTTMGPTMGPAQPDPTKPTTPTPPTVMSSTSKTVPATTKPKESSGDTIGTAIVIVIVLAAIVFGAACYFTRKRGRRYSVDLHSRQDDAQIPLSTVEPTDAVSQNGMRTFDSVETDKKEQEELVAKPEGQEEQKSEPDKSTADPGLDPAAAAPSTDGSADKAKEDVVEQPPAKPVEQSLEEKTDDEGTVSNKTSVESLKEPNENNSNNVATGTAAIDWKPNNIVSEVPSDSPV